MRPWRYPPSLDFQYGDWLRARFERGNVAPWPTATSPDLATLLTIHPVMVGDAIGWVAHTPDGLWDASRGAERFVEVFQNGTVVKVPARESRRQPKTIQARLKDVGR